VVDILKELKCQNNKTNADGKRVIYNEIYLSIKPKVCKTAGTALKENSAAAAPA